MRSAAWKPEIGLEIPGSINAPSSWWKELGSKVTSQLVHHPPSEVFADHLGSADDQEKPLKKTSGFVRASSAVSIKEWVAEFRKNNEDPTAQAALIKIALTPVSVFDQGFFAEQIEKTKLNSTSVTSFWIGARRIACAPCNLKSPPPAGPTVAAAAKPRSRPQPRSRRPQPKSLDKQDQDVSFDASAKKDKVPGLFVSRSFHEPDTGTGPGADVRKHQDARRRAVANPLMDSEWKEAGPEITAHFDNMFDHVIDKDKEALTDQWKSNHGGRLTKHSAKLTCRMQVRKRSPSVC